MRRLGTILVACLGLLHAEDVGLTPDHVVERGLAALVRLQTPEGTFAERPGITALAGMALLAGGHTPTRGHYREASARTLDAVLAGQDPMTGYLAAGAGDMYDHGLATLYLAECVGMSPDRRTQGALAAAIDLIHRCQNSEGGWRYLPAPLDADLSVTVCQMMAIRAANNVAIGGAANQGVMAKALSYVRRSAQPDGGFSYKIGSPAGAGADGVPLAAAGIMCLIGAGVSDPADAVLGSGLRLLRRQVGSHLAGRLGDPAVWDHYCKLARPAIARLQSEDGLWTQAEHGAAFASAMALIVLQIPNQYLPIFQR